MFPPRDDFSYISLELAFGIPFGLLPSKRVITLIAFELSAFMRIDLTWGNEFENGT
jgi:hypothetical protein